MNRIRLIPILPCVSFLLSVVPPALDADEGMWRPAQMTAVAPRLDELGLEIDPTMLTDLTGFPMGAVISLGGCTASFVSPGGLAVTNHHCAYGAIQYNSTEDENLLETGFLAERPSEELPAGPGSRILVTVAVEDVSDEVRRVVPQAATGAERWEAIAAKEKELVTRCELDVGHRCKVASYHGGLQYELIKQLEIKDVRLVYAPAGSIGVFGGEIDNWMWPRHTGDFAFYRAYVAPDGKPAEHSAENVPFRPNHHLQVARRPLDEGDFVMALGYPGTTSRYRLASEVEDTFGWLYPTRIDRYQEWYDVIAAETAGDTDLEIRYSGLVRSLENSLKNYKGMLDGFARGDTVERKKALEADLQSWIEADANRRARYISTLEELHRLVDRARATREREMMYEYLAWRGELARTAKTLYRLAREKEKPDTEREQGYQMRDEPRIRERLDRIDRTFAATVDQAIWTRFILDYTAIPTEQRVADFDDWLGLTEGGFSEPDLRSHLQEMYATTSLTDRDARLAWLDATAAEIEASDDPFLRLAVATYESSLSIEAENKDLAGRFDEVRSRYMAALKEYLAERDIEVYPDANSTLRVTYGTVAGYSPRDAVVYEPFTHLPGIVEKNTGVEPFNAPEEQLEAIALESADVPVNFLSTLDSTGGNSGSATLDAHGELVGLLFDGVWESIIADWDFIPALTRTIHVDMRYVVWVMRHVDGAEGLLEEMGIGLPD